MTINDIVIIGVMFLLPFVFFAVILYIDRCPKGKQHDYELIKSKYIKGNDIGFGITNSYFRETHKCKKCDKIIDLIS